MSQRSDEAKEWAWGKPAEMLEGWEQISWLFRCERQTVVNKYGNEMLRTGVVCKSRVQGKWVVWAHVGMVQFFIAWKQANQGFV